MKFMKVGFHNAKRANNYSKKSVPVTPATITNSFEVTACKIITRKEDSASRRQTQFTYYLIQILYANPELD